MNPGIKIIKVGMACGPTGGLLESMREFRRSLQNTVCSSTTDIFTLSVLVCVSKQKPVIAHIPFIITIFSA